MDTDIVTAIHRHGIATWSTNPRLETLFAAIERRQGTVTVTRVRNLTIASVGLPGQMVQRHEGSGPSNRVLLAALAKALASYPVPGEA